MKLSFLQFKELNFRFIVSMLLPFMAEVWKMLSWMLMLGSKLVTIDIILAKQTFRQEPDGSPKEMVLSFGVY